MKNKGFAITGILYSILVLFLILLALLIFSLQSKKTILDRLKSNTMDEIEGVVKGKSSDNLGPTMINATIDETHKGIVYLDPTDLSKYCDESNSVSTTETKTGCMKWYIFNDSGDNYTMILDHNTTARIKWNDSKSNVAYESSNLKAVVDDLVTTSGWEVTPRLITAEEVNQITGKTGFDASNTSSWYYLDTLTQTKADFTSSRSKYDWLYNNLNKCKTDSTDYGCTIEDNNTYSGYGTAGEGQTWSYLTSTPVGTAGSGSRVWRVDRNGYLEAGIADSTGFGVRPVITISKDIIKNEICPYEENHEFTFDYTGNVQTFKTPCSGNYKLEVWGAQGGAGKIGDTSNAGGKGGYSYGNVSLSTDDTLYVYVGQKGATLTTPGCSAATFNGGGSACTSNYYFNDRKSLVGASGGGATDIRINDKSLYARVIVAGGGGGGQTYGASITENTGFGGGLNGQDGTYDRTTSVYAKGGTQIAGGTGGTFGAGAYPYAESGTFGQGGTSLSNTQNATYYLGSGGGGGWYGGGGGGHASGAGGSGWIYTSDSYNNWKDNSTEGKTGTWLLSDKYYLSNANTIDGGHSMPTHNGSSTMTGNTNNGYAKITYLGK